MRAVLIVPYRPDGGWRDTLEAWTRARWLSEHPEIPYHAAAGPLDGPFNRSQAINDAADAAGDWDLAIVADADSFVEGDAIERACALAVDTGQMVIAHDRWRRLSRAGTRRILSGFNGWWEPFVEFDLPMTVSSMIVIPKALWIEARGFDPGFAGWGMEDIGFHAACDRLRGGTGRIPGPVWHLWHPTRGRSIGKGNADRMHRYTDCATRDEMLALIEELRA